MRKLFLISAILLFCGIFACKDGSDSNSSTCTDAELFELEASITSALTSAVTDVDDFSLLLESVDGRTYSFHRGTSTGTTSYQSASTSKLITAVVILFQIENWNTGLSLDSNPQDFISFWDMDSDVKLRHLLSFTSGFWNEPLCLNNPSADFSACVRKIYDANNSLGVESGSEYYYSSTHLQIAGLMAVNAGGFSDWGELFERFKVETGLFSDSAYDLPSSTNPRLAGGMHWTADEYLAFLRKLYNGELLSTEMTTALWRNQRGDAVVLNSPALSGIGEDWGYGFGNWAECESQSYDCGASLHRNSSPGAYGAYPFIDFDYNYFGILARQGRLGTFTEGFYLFKEIEDLAVQWASNSCRD